ncbi:uncharacterized protein J3D65DRAFT_222106 [Phyllosticta citribraziliensis]|uniref:R3H domain-containing protein n=1 Tax=Phyllosticta citribraziliensis TaxID=989973 RepID=A0ABR1M4T6_9PEZI
MSSQAPAVSETQGLRPSFAKVAASAYHPQNTKETTTNPKSANSPQVPVILQKPLTSPENAGAPLTDGPMENGESNGDCHRAPSPDGHEPSTEAHIRNGTIHGPTVGQVLRPAAGTARPVVSDDNATQVSSSNSSVKPPSLDGKSVASGTTFALDEKESIRPDDSASIRAVEEDREDVFSPPDSVAPGSRVGSDTGAGRAFRDQLNEISATSHRGILPARMAQTSNSNEVNRPSPLSLGSIQENDGVSQPQPMPDEKLLEALQSPRDRLFVLKLEQDVLDFLRNTEEKELDVPNCNAFYRMLAHRFADYYLLGHVVDPVTSAVKITKTSYSRMPPPLSGLPSALSSGPETPPIMVPARKIMRREDGKPPSGTNTTANSDGPSKTTSEVGGDSGSDAGQGPRKLTREEREAKYKEARQRIFGSAEDGDLGDLAKDNEGKDMSRSSSAAGRKNKKKPRNNDDDGFEARSQFSPYFPPQYGGPGYSNGAQPMYYGPVNSMAPQTNVNPPVSSPFQGQTGFPVMVQQEAQHQYSWQLPQFASPPTGSINPAPFGAPMPVNYDISSDFQQRMSFQQNNNTKVTPRMSSVPLAGHPDGYRPQSQGVNQPWPQVNVQMPYQFPQGFNDRPMSAGQSYAYGQLPNPSFGNNRNQHPLPGSFNRQQFNPQSQAFVPSFVPGMRGAPGYNMPAQSPQMASVAPNMVGYPGYMGMHQQGRPGQPAPQPQFNSIRQPPNPAFMKTGIPNQGISHPLPQPVSAAPLPGAKPASMGGQSSIAKWGTPSHLPPKPPPPASLPPQQKFMGGPQNNRTTPPMVPSQHNAPGTYAIPSIMSNGGSGVSSARSAK